jgi:acetyl-CoA carboxylase biotin carboxyl carrier protein
MIDIKYLKQLLELFDESSVNDIRLEKEGTSIRLTKTPKNEGSSETQVHYVPQPASGPLPSPPPAAPAPNAGEPSAAPAPAEGEAEDDHGNYHEIRSPIVGTFYGAPSPDSDPFVKPGDEVSPGDVLCIVEAMKLMNEIESDASGKVVKVLVENAEPVEYDQVLFLIEA